MVTKAADDAILQRLLPHAESIGLGEQSGVAFVPGTWKEWCSEAGWSGGPGVIDELAEYGDLTRENLAELASRSDGTSGLMRLFVASLVWGRGKSNGRMKPNLVRAIREMSGDPSVLLATARFVRSSQFQAAYEACAIPGLREAFLTKWLYAAGLVLPRTAARPLVLDARVRASLRSLGWWYRSQPAVRYADYVDSVHRWGIMLHTPGVGVSGDQLELFLFDRNGDL